MSPSYAELAAKSICDFLSIKKEKFENSVTVLGFCTGNDQQYNYSVLEAQNTLLESFRSMKITSSTTEQYT